MRLNWAKKLKFSWNTSLMEKTNGKNLKKIWEYWFWIPLNLAVMTWMKNQKTKGGENLKIRKKQQRKKGKKEIADKIMIKN